MTKTYFTTLVRNRETKRKEEKIVAGDMFKIKINDTILYCGIYRPGKKREYYIVELNSGLSFGALYIGPKEKAIDSMLRAIILLLLQLLKIILRALTPLILRL